VKQTKILFVPVSGPGGAGEYYRCLAVARAIERRWPAVDIRFVLSRDAAYAEDTHYPVRLVDRSPTHCTGQVIAILDEERPDLVVFDSSGRVAQYAHARRLGARIVFVSSRPSTRRKGFRLRRLRHFDQYWIAQPRFLGGGLTRLERLRCRFAPALELLFLETLFEPPDPVASARLQAELGLEPDRYLLVCPGGAGVFPGRADPAQLYYQTARAAAVAGGLPVVAVLGARFVAPAGPLPAGLHLYPTLPNATLMGLLQDARLAVLNGGSLLVQALAQRSPVVAAPIADDQPDRIAECARRGLIDAADFDAGDLCRKTLTLAADTDRRSELRARLAALGLRNGAEVAAEAVGRLLQLPGPAPAPVERLRILQVILSRGFAGSERAAVEACNALCVRHEVALVVRREHRSPGGASLLDHLDPRVRVHEVPGWLGSAALGEIIEAWAPHVIHTHLRRGTRWVAQLEPDAAHVSTLHLSINGPHFLQSDALICISEWQLATVPADYRGKAWLIPNSLVRAPRLAPERVAELRAELGARPGERLIGGVGRLASSKGFDLLIRAFEQAGLPDARLVIIGEGSARAKLQRIAGERVRLAGFRADAKECFQALDLFVSPSRSEPFGRVIIEALDAGTPVIATDVAGPRDIAQRYPVELVPGEDERALAEALRRALAAPPRRLEVDLAEFDIERVAARLEEVYRTTLRLRAGQPRRS
jgi:glycosyltransferase involved in cell wall biosynthesis